MAVVLVVVVLVVVVPMFNRAETVATPWDSATLIEGTDDTLQVEYLTGVCNEHEVAEVDETSESVTVTVLITEDDEVDVCPGVGVTRSLEVQLVEPLGTRKVVDGAK